MRNLIKAKVGKKGQATWIAQILVSLSAIGVVAFLYFLLFSRYFDIHAVVRSNEAKRHVINMAQVLLSSDKLVYEEYFGNGMKRFHRGVFNKTKLDEQLINEEYFEGYGTVTKDSEIQREVSYPNTGTTIIVYDMVSETRWILSFGGPGLEYSGEFFDCLGGSMKDEGFFDELFNIFGPWDFWEALSCFGTYITKIGIFEKDFPVLIKDGEDVHAGILFIRMMEL